MPSSKDNISGTILSGISALCMGQPRVNFKEGRKLVTLFVNFLVGISQFFTITFMFVGWFWSIAWGGLLIIHSCKFIQTFRYSESLSKFDSVVSNKTFFCKIISTNMQSHENMESVDLPS